MATIHPTPQHTPQVCRIQFFCATRTANNPHPLVLDTDATQFQARTASGSQAMRRKLPCTHILLRSWLHPAIRAPFLALDQVRRLRTTHPRHRRIACLQARPSLYRLVRLPAAQVPPTTARIRPSAGRLLLLRLYRSRSLSAARHTSSNPLPTIASTATCSLGRHTYEHQGSRSQTHLYDISFLTSLCTGQFIGHISIFFLGCTNMDLLTAHLIAGTLYYDSLRLRCFAMSSMLPMYAYAQLCFYILHPVFLNDFTFNTKNFSSWLTMSLKDHTGCVSIEQSLVLECL